MVNVIYHADFSLVILI